MNPNSKIWLCKTDLENNYKNTLTFASKQAQQNYFIGNPNVIDDFGTSTKSYTDFTYLRRDRYIKVDDLIDNIDSNNYLVLLNQTKYYYYFITSMEYIDDSTTRINIELDVMQTYFFDIKYNQTFIEREHVTNDTPGAHTVPEGLETGEFVSNGTGLFNTNWDTYGVCISVVPEDLKPSSWTYTEYGGIYSGTLYLFFQNMADARWYLEQVSSDIIVGVFMYPLNLTPPGTSWNIDGHIISVISPDSTGQTHDNTILNSKPTSINGYTPRNKKLLTKDYCYLVCDNGTGVAKTYNYEDFSSSNIVFKTIACMSLGGSVIQVPLNYKGATENLMENIPNSKFPVCSYTGDSYTNWLTQNSVNAQANVVSDIGTIVGGLALSPGNPALGGSMLGTGILHVYEDLKGRSQVKKLPDSIHGNIASGDVNYTYNKCKVRYYQMSIKEEYARIIDKYFDLYGYKVNVVKAPNIHTRSNWNFIKTQSCSFSGDIPEDYMSKIRNIFDNGITFWHNPNTMLDYTQTNSVL